MDRKKLLIESVKDNIKYCNDKIEAYEELRVAPDCCIVERLKALQWFEKMLYMIE